MNLNGKHIIVGFQEHIFTRFYLDLLVNEGVVKRESILFVSIDGKGIEWCEIELGVQAISFEMLDLGKIDGVKTVTFISLHKWNSQAADALIESSENLIERTIFYLTDDEVDRWLKIKQKSGFLTAEGNEKFNVSEADFKVLSKAKKFISTKIPFRSKLEFLLERDDFEIIEARDPFSTMYVNRTRLYTKVLRNLNAESLVEDKIIVGSKPGVFKFKFILLLIFGIFMSKSKKIDKIVFPVEFEITKRMVFFVFVHYLLRRLGKRKINVNLLGPTSTLAYTTNLISCKYFLLQGRGGMSSARTFARLGKGVIVVERGSANHLELSEGLGLDVLAYSSVKELLARIECERVNTNQNSVRAYEDQKKSIDNLKVLYQR